jgi:lipopolysaccharide export system protein LptC
MNRSALARHLAAAEAGERRNIAGTYRAAARHTRRVRLLRRTVPAAAIAIVLMVVLGAWLDPLKLFRELPLEFARMAISGNTLKIDAPKLSGYTRDGRTYSISAVSAAQDLGKPGVIELAGIEAQLALADGGTTKLTATKGTLDAKAELLRLIEGIDILSTSGFGGRLGEAIVDMRKGHVLAPSPVELRYRDGWIRANRLEVFDNGTRVLFDGGVTTMFRLNPPQPAPTVGVNP